jgi:hypothetical protein
MFIPFKHLTRRRRFCGLVATLISVAGAGCGERVVPAPPAKVVFENSLFRILDVNVPPGTTLKHPYENDVTTIVMRDGARTRTHSPGADWGEETITMVGAVRLGEAGEHGVQNVGEGDFQMFAVENLRDGGGGGSTPTPQPASGMTPAAESASFGAYELRLADNNFQVSHVHTAPAVAVLVKGRILSQGSESKDPKIGEAPSGLKQLDQPGQWVFVPPGEAHYVVRLGGEPSHVVEVELR